MLCTNFEVFTDDSGLGFVHGFLFKIPVSQFALFQPTIQADASMFRYLIQVKIVRAVTSLTQLLALFFTNDNDFGDNYCHYYHEYGYGYHYYC